MALSGAERTAAYRARHPERVKKYKEENKEKIRGSNRLYRERVGPHPQKVTGSDAYKKYRATENYQRTYMNAHLKRHYGITYEQYEEMFKSQGGVCKICLRPDANRVFKDGRTQRSKLFVDHDHKTGEIRGLLCNTCNVGIANLKESVEILKSAIRYLEKQ